MIVRSYVITTDRGSAPNYESPFTTLAICKPRIRKKARKGELIIGFNGRTLSPERNSVCWAGVVSEVLTFSEYWLDPRFESKKPDQSETPDNIYCVTPHGLEQIENSSHNSSNIDTDLSGLNVLIFSEVWHFGPNYVPLDSRFSKFYVGGTRRHEPENEISRSEWIALRKWLTSQDPALSFEPDREGGRCRTANKGREVTARQALPGRC